MRPAFGDSASAEMRPVVEALQRLLSAADVRCAGSVEDAVQRFGPGDWHPDVVIVCQHFESTGKLARLIAHDE